MEQRLGKVTLAEVIRRAVEARLKELRVSLPTVLRPARTCVTSQASTETSLHVEPLGVLTSLRMLLANGPPVRQDCKDMIEPTYPPDGPVECECQQYGPEQGRQKRRRCEHRNNGLC